MILLDTCAVLWLAAGSERLSAGARDLLASQRGKLFVSAITGFEVGAKHVKGKLELPLPPDEWIERVLGFHGLREIPVTSRIAAQSTLLPRLHADPADRMIVATAQVEELTILTPDTLIAAYPDTRVVWP